MSLVELETDAGLYVIDDETGELVDYPVGTDKVAGLVRQLHAAKEQEKEWAKAKAILTQAVLREQAEHKVLYGDLAATKRQDSYSWLDVDTLRADLGEMEMTRDELRATVLAVKSFDVALLPEAIAGLVKSRTQQKTKSPWVDVSVVKKAAPRVRLVTEEVSA